MSATGVRFFRARVGPRYGVLSTMLGRRKTQVAIAILVSTAFVMAFGATIAPYPPNEQNLLQTLAAPSPAHWLGTDELGRDVLSRLLVAARIDVGVGLVGALLPFFLGSALGVMAGYFGSWPDFVVTRAAEMAQAFPVYVLALALVTIVGGGATAVIVAYTAIGWVSYARLMRVTTRRVSREEYIDAARLGGIGHGSTIVRHILPNASRECLALLALHVTLVMIALAAFSYLGIGVAPPTSEWGAMIAAGQPYLRDQWWLCVAPGLCIGVVGLGFVLLAEAIEEAGRESDRGITGDT